MTATPISVMHRGTLVLLSLAIIALVAFMLAPVPFITVYHFRYQDLPILILVVFLGIILRPALPYLARRLPTKILLSNGRKPAVLLVAITVFLIAGVGTFAVFHSFPLSMDEFWARADGEILATGRPMVPVSVEWLPYARALQPIFLRLYPQPGYWASEYLPVNALIQYVLGPFASPFLAALSTLLVASIAGRMMPAERHAPLVCAILFAVSSQLLVAAMTPYAMSAHLAFNLAWLWLFLRPRAIAQVSAAVVGVAAMGLHQFAFFPLFAAPFLFEAFLMRRRAIALFQFVTIVAGFLLWSNYDALLQAILGVSSAGEASGTAGLVHKVWALVSGFGLASFALTSLNLLRFCLWQNPVAVPLMLMVSIPLLRRAGWWRALLGGIVLTTLFMLVVLPFQGHGWGYRYLHGLLGNLALLATFAFYRLAPSGAQQGEWRAFIAGMTAIAALVLLPIHMVQAWWQARPYVAADAAISKLDADIVVIDAPAHAYSIDLVRNDPLLRNRPKRMAYAELNDGQLERLCRDYKVLLFDERDAERFGIARWWSPAESTRTYPEECSFERFGSLALRSMSFPPQGVAPLSRRLRQN